MVRVARTFTPEVIVVSDGSVDGTVGAAREAGAQVVDLAVNVGKGAHCTRACGRRGRTW